MQTVTSRVFNQSPTAVKQKANTGPVRITERGKVSHVLMSIEDYEALTGQTKSIVDLLAMPEPDLDLAFEKLNLSTISPVDFD